MAGFRTIALDPSCKNDANTLDHRPAGGKIYEGPIFTQLATLAKLVLAHL